MDSPLQDYLETLHRELHPQTGGDIARYATELTSVDPNDFGIALTTLDGITYSTGAARVPFAIQSISKAFTYGVALEASGFEAVDALIDVEPSGEAYNEISLQEGSGRPANALINAGAIATASMVNTGSTDSGDPAAPILSAYSRLAGRDLTIDPHVLAIERAHGDRNLAMAHLLRSFSIIDGTAHEVADAYFAACSILVDAEDLSVMAALLATGGVHPVTGERVLSTPVVQRVLSVMSTCGMYDDAGEWMVRVGVPAKSGVGGGIIAVVPGQVGIATYSPRLDHHGNSVRGVLACERLSADLGLHLMRGAHVQHETVRVRYPITEAPSGVRRQAPAQESLLRAGHRAQVWEVQGDLNFGAAESVLRDLVSLPPEVEFVVLDVRRVTDVADFARRSMQLVEQAYADHKRTLVILDDSSLVTTSAHESSSGQVFSSRREAIEWVEEQLVARHSSEPSYAPQVDAASSVLLSGLGEGAAAEFSAAMDPRHYREGDIVVGHNDPFTGVFIITRGVVETSVPDAGGEPHRVSVLGPGMSFGEFGLIGDGRHSVTVTAKADLEVAVLTPEALATVDREHPALALQLWRAMSREAYTQVRAHPIPSQ